jgi:hypothetical protein
MTEFRHFFISSVAKQISFLHKCSAFLSSSGAADYLSFDASSIRRYNGRERSKQEVFP